MEYEEKFRGMAHAGQHASRCLSLLKDLIVPGWSTARIDAFVSDYAKANDLICATKGYKGFPAYCCTSVNHVVCHGIPSLSKILKDGDLLKVDITFINKDGWHGDTCRTYFVGDASVKATRVAQVAKEAMDRAIAIIRPGVTFGHLGRVCEEYVNSQRMGVVKGYCGHGIGQEFHTLPPILHYYDPKSSYAHQPILEGMTFTVEPMVTFGKSDVKELSDGWSVVTKDRSLSAQWEHTIGVVANGHHIFTAY